MKILAIADRPPKQSIKKILSENTDIELICLLGDLDYYSLLELKDIDTIPKIGVYGNHCSGTYFDVLGVQNIHLNVFEYKGLCFGGFEGCVRYKEDPYAKMYTQDEAIKLFESFPKVDVILSHCPPFGINDEEEIAHQGFIALKTYLDIHKPLYLMHGHTYPKDTELVTEYRGTNIVYVYSDKVLEI